MSIYVNSVVKMKNTWFYTLYWIEITKELLDYNVLGYRNILESFKVIHLSANQLTWNYKTILY